MSISALMRIPRCMGRPFFNQAVRAATPARAALPRPYVGEPLAKTQRISFRATVRSETERSSSPTKAKISKYVAISNTFDLPTVNMFNFMRVDVDIKNREAKFVLMKPASYLQDFDDLIDFLPMVHEPVKKGDELAVIAVDPKKLGYPDEDPTSLIIKALSPSSKRTPSSLFPLKRQIVTVFRNFNQEPLTNMSICSAMSPFSGTVLSINKYFDKQDPVEQELLTMSIECEKELQDFAINPNKTVGVEFSETTNPLWIKHAFIVRCLIQKQMYEKYLNNKKFS